MKKKPPGRQACSVALRNVDGSEYLCLDWLLSVEFVYVDECLLNNICILQSCRTPSGAVGQIKFLPRFRRSHFRLLDCTRCFVEHEETMCFAAPRVAPAESSSG